MVSVPILSRLLRRATAVADDLPSHSVVPLFYLLLSYGGKRDLRMQLYRALHAVALRHTATLAQSLAYIPTVRTHRHLDSFSASTAFMMLLRALEDVDSGWQDLGDVWKVVDRRAAACLEPSWRIKSVAICSRILHRRGSSAEFSAKCDSFVAGALRRSTGPFYKTSLNVEEGKPVDFGGTLLPLDVVHLANIVSFTTKSRPLLSRIAEVAESLDGRVPFGSSECVQLLRALHFGGYTSTTLASRMEDRIVFALTFPSGLSRGPSLFTSRQAPLTNTDFYSILLFYVEAGCLGDSFGKAAAAVMRTLSEVGMKKVKASHLLRVLDCLEAYNHRVERKALLSTSGVRDLVNDIAGTLELMFHSCTFALPRKEKKGSVTTRFVGSDWCRPQDVLELARVCVVLPGVPSSRVLRCVMQLSRCLRTLLPTQSAIVMLETSAAFLKSVRRLLPEDAFDGRVPPPADALNLEDAPDGLAPWQVYTSITLQHIDMLLGLDMKVLADSIIPFIQSLMGVQSLCIMPVQSFALREWLGSLHVYERRELAGSLPPSQLCWLLARIAGTFAGVENDPDQGKFHVTCFCNALRERFLPQIAASTLVSDSEKVIVYAAAKKLLVPRDKKLTLHRGRRSLTTAEVHDVISSFVETSFSNFTPQRWRGMPDAVQGALMTLLVRDNLTKIHISAVNKEEPAREKLNQP